MKIYVSAQSAAGGAAFRKRHSLVEKDIAFIENQDSSFAALNAIIASEPGPCLYMREDAYVDEGFTKRVNETLEILAGVNWGVAGSLGIGCNLYGITASPLVKYAIDPAGGPNLPGRPLPAMSVGGGALLLNAPLLRAKRVFLPDFDGHEFFDLALSLKTVQAGLSCWLIPQMLCFCQANPIQKDREWEEYGPGLLEYFAAQISNTRIDTIYGTKYIFRPHGATDWPREALKNSLYGKLQVAMIVRSQFARKALLLRTLQTLRAFTAASGQPDMYRIYVFTDRSEIPDWLPEYTRVVSCAPPPGVSDTRLFLVKEAVGKVEADYFWFIDDDDWLFPNRAEFISQSILASPRESTFYVGAMLFHEKNPVSPDTWSSQARRGIYYDPREFIKSNSGVNVIPFCGIIFPAAKLARIVGSNGLEYVSYGEDYCLELLNMYDGEFFPVVIDSLAAGISIRESGNTVTEADRTIWNTSSCAIMASVLGKSSLLINLPAFMRDYHQLEKPAMMDELKFSELKMLLKRKVLKKINFLFSRLIGKFIS